MQNPHSLFGLVLTWSCCGTAVDRSEVALKQIWVVLVSFCSTVNSWGRMIVKIGGGVHDDADVDDDVPWNSLVGWRWLRKWCRALRARPLSSPTWWSQWWCCCWWLWQHTLIWWELENSPPVEMGERVDDGKIAFKSDRHGEVGARRYCRLNWSAWLLSGFWRWTKLTALDPKQMEANEQKYITLKDRCIGQKL